MDRPAEASRAESLQSDQAALERVFEGFDLQSVRQALRRQLGAGDGPGNGEVMHRSDQSKAAFESAGELARKTGRDDVSPLCLLAAILSAPDRDIGAALDTLGADVVQLKQRAREALERDGGPDGTPFLDRYGRDLTQMAREGKLAPLVGRRDEMLELVRALKGATRNNPVLIGEAGVGKTAIVEGLAQRISGGKSLPGKRIVELSLASLVAGTKYRGEFEERLTRVIAELQAHRERVIVFLDEIHFLVGAGGAGGSLDASDILKPVLARGEITCIGATTSAEYRAHIEKDPSLERRFRPVLVNEPSPDAAAEILRGRKAGLEQHHGVEIGADAIEAAIELTVRYLPNLRLPDKAVDALDQACARVHVPMLSAMNPDPAAPTPLPGAVTHETVAEVVAQRTGLPVHALGADEASNLLRLEEDLRRRLVGQDDAVARVAARVRQARVGLVDPRRPVGVFLFLGPTGVGKTALAQALAAALFGSEDQIIRIDMSEYQESHAVSRLIGAPPGYVGHDEEGYLTGRLRGKPYSVVLLDEIEKAHPQVFDVFLQLFDEGRLTDGKGRTIIARHAVFIMTSNLPPRQRMGFNPQASAADIESTLREVRQHFRPEFANRIDEQITFRQLNQEQVLAIARPQIDAVKDELLRRHQIALDVPAEATALLARLGHDPESGVRELTRVVDRLLRAPLSDRILRRSIGPRDRIVAMPAGETLEFKLSNQTV